MLASACSPCTIATSGKARFGQEPFYICVPADHRLAHKATAAIRDRHGEKVPWIPRSVQRRLYDATTKYIHSIGVEVVIREVRGAVHVIKFVSHGFRLGSVPGSAIRLMRTGVVFKQVADQYQRIGRPAKIAGDRLDNLRRQPGAVLGEWLRRWCSSSISLQRAVQ
jgi:DNA-binding transcriptional LysR family regulator